MNESLYLRYYLRMPHNVGTSFALESLEAYEKVHEIVCELSYKMWIKPTQIDTSWPARTSDHFVTFVTILISKEEEFDKVLFKLALKYGVQVRKKQKTYRLTEN